MNMKEWRELNLDVRVVHHGRGRIRARAKGFGYVEVLVADPSDLAAVQKARRLARDRMIAKARSEGCTLRIPG